MSNYSELKKIVYNTFESTNTIEKDSVYKIVSFNSTD